MKVKSFLVALLAIPALLHAAETITYDVAHVRRQDANMAFVKISPNFFNSDAPIQAKWYTAVQACVRSTRLAGEAVVVSNFTNRFMYYGSKAWKPFLSSIDMKRMNARVNKAVTCKY